MIKKMHVSEAIQHLLKSEKKVARVLLPTFFNLLDHAQRKGLQPYRLFVHGLILGKQDRYTGLRYKAKSRSSK
jgi:ribosomal protein L22